MDQGSWRAAALAAAGTALAGPAAGHTGAQAGRLQSGFLHPILILDHVVAMVAVGLCGAILGHPAVWTLPVVFPLMMVVADPAVVAGVPLPGVEAGIAVPEWSWA